MSDRPMPAVTISLVTWNGLRWLPGCLDSVAAQTFDDYELLVLDNGSDDGSVEWLRERAAGDERITLVESDRNLGYARGHNRNIEAARGEALLLLNQDVELDPGFLAAAAAALAEHPDAGSVQALVWRLEGPGVHGDVVDTTGLVMYRDRRVVSRDQLRRVTDPGVYRGVPVWGADGPAPVFRRSALLQAREPRSSGGLEVLDEDFFAYKEDVDLAWRLQRLGWGAWFEPAARAWHARGGGDTGVSGWREVVRANMANAPGVRTLSWRNQRLMQLKNEEPGALLRDLPWVASRELQSWIFVLFADPRRLVAVPALLRALPAARRKRRYLGAAVRAAREGRSRPRPLGTRLLSRMRVSVVGKVVEHVRLHGFRAMVRRVFDKLRERFDPAQRRWQQQAPVAAVRPGAIRIELDRPRYDGLEGSARVNVLGWAHATAGVEAVELYLDDAFAATAFLGRSRPDVEVTRQHLSLEGISGFGAIVSLEGVDPGHHLLYVVVRDRAGNVRVKARPFRRLDPLDGYQRFYERTSAATAVESPGDPPAMSVHIVLDARAEGDLVASLHSLAAQGSTRWTCTVLSGADRLELVRGLVERSLSRQDADRCGVVTDPGMALPAEVDRSRLFAFLAGGDRFGPGALGRFAGCASATGAAVVYADHDVIDDLGRHRDPWFVPDWSPDRLLAQDYIRGAFVVRDDADARGRLAELLRSGGPGWRYGLLLELTQRADGIEHLPQVLWSESWGGQDERAEAEVVAVEAALRQRGAEAAVEPSDGSGTYPWRRLAWSLPADRPTVSVIVPTTGRPDLVEGTLRTLGAGTSYRPLELVVVDNSRGRNPDGIARFAASGATVVERDEPFNWSRLNDAGVRAASGDLLLFLNDDMGSVDPGWLDELVRQVLRPDVGVAGSLLLYPDGMIQHAGVLLVGHGGGAAHLLQGLDPDDDLYLDLQRVTREVSAVTGACMITRREVFEEVGGFDEELEVSGNDVDFCLRVAATGRRVLWTPHSRLVHHESRSRGSVPYLPDQPRLWERWAATLRAGDRYFNPNLDQDRVDCDLDWRVVED